MDKPTINTITARIEANAQRKKFEGQDYQVVPVIALVEGVHSGSAGAAYYPGDEISKFVEAWNGVPLPVQHPMDSDGDYVSCNSPETIEKQSVGYHFNAHYENGKLKGELWINIEKAKRIAPVVLEILNSGRLLEVSTSFFSDQDYKSGEWNGEKYEMVIKNIRPDHLALLPGGVGACSVADGCGAPRVNQEGGEKMDGNDKSVGKIKACLTQFVKSLGFKIQEVSHEEMREQIQRVLDGYDTKETVDVPISHFVREVYDDHFIYEQYSQEGTKLFKQSYKKEGDNTIKLGKKSEEVRQETEYVSVKSNAKNTKGGERNMDKVKEMATVLIANELTSFKDDDREFLEGLTEDQLGKLEPKVNEVKHPDEKAVTALIALESSPFEDKDKEMLSGLNECQFKALVEKYPEKKEDPKANKEDKPLTTEEYIAKAPEAIQDVLANAMKLQDEQKAAIVKGLLANKRNTFTEDQLKSKKLDELEALAGLAQVDVDYSGNGISANKQEDNGDVLVLPTLEDFKTKK